MLHGVAYPHSVHQMIEIIRTLSKISGKLQTRSKLWWIRLLLSYIVARKLVKFDKETTHNQHLSISCVSIRVLCAQIQLRQHEREIKIVQCQRE